MIANHKRNTNIAKVAAASALIVGTGAIGALEYAARRIKPSPVAWIPRSKLTATVMTEDAFLIDASIYGALDRVSLRTADNQLFVLGAQDYRTHDQRNGDQPVIRSFRQIQGDPLNEGDIVTLNPGADAGFTPADFQDITADEVNITTPLGTTPASLYSSKTNLPSGTLFICTHGRGSDRKEFYKLAEAIAPAGHQALAITYRNDYDGWTTTPDGVCYMGATEWEDLTGAVEWATASGYRNIYLVGNSQGGSVTSFWLRKAYLDNELTPPPTLRGVILDSPMLSLSGALDLTYTQMGIPLATSYARASRWWLDTWHHFGTQTVEHVDTLAQLPLPILIFQGQKDTDIPIAYARKLAQLAPHHVELHENQYAPHCCTWNVDPVTYSEKLLAFAATHNV